MAATKEQRPRGKKQEGSPIDHIAPAAPPEPPTPPAPPPAPTEEKEALPDYMSAWTNQQNILWGTISALFVFLGLIVSLLANDKLCLIVSAFTSFITSLVFALFGLLTMKIRMNIAVLEYYIGLQETRHTWPTPPADAELKRYCINPDKDRERYVGGWFTGRTRVGKPNSQIWMSVVLLGIAGFFVFVWVSCLYWGFATDGWFKLPYWIVQPTQEGLGE